MAGEAKEKRTRRPRRSPEELLKELKLKLEKQERRLYKKNNEAVFAIGQAVIRESGFDISSLGKEEIDRIISDREYARETIRPILEKSLASL